MDNTRDISTTRIEHNQSQLIKGVYGEVEDTFWTDVKYTAGFMVSPRTLRFLPQIMWTGISLAYITGMISLIIARTIPDADNDKQLELSLYGLSVIGIGEMIGSIIMSQIIDRISNRAAVIVNMCIIAILWLLSGIMISRNKDDFFLYVFCFGWGFMDGTVNTHCGQILGFEFETAQDPFSVMMIG